MNVQNRVRVAVAEHEKVERLAPRLGRALKFAIYDVSLPQVRGPFYRVRHDDPGTSCGNHEELTALLADCQAVIAGSAGDRMVARLHGMGVEAVKAEAGRSPTELVVSYLSEVLERNERSGPDALRG